MSWIDRHIEAPPESGLTLVFDTLNRVNRASADNDIDIIRRLVIDNPGRDRFSDIRLTVRASPAVIAEKTWCFDEIAPMSELTIRDLSTPLNAGELEALKKARAGTLEFRLESDKTAPIIGKARIDLLPPEQWGGVPDMAELLAAFVLPEDPVIAGLLAEASRQLAASGLDSTMNGYRSRDSRSCCKLVEAIWSAAAGLELTGIEPLADLAHEGQAVRPPWQILKEGRANCLDTSLFLAAAFEAAGLNPVVLFSRGHAWVGVWTRERDFGHVTEADVSDVRKVARGRDFVPIDTRLLTVLPGGDFEQAVAEGRRHLSEAHEDEFVMAVDIARSRMWVRPLEALKAPETAELTNIARSVDAGLSGADGESGSDAESGAMALDPERFFEADYAPVLRQLIRNLVEKESPIPLNRLIRRVSQEHGWQRSGRRIQQRVQKILVGLAENHTEFKTDFVWALGAYADRMAFRGLERRAIQDVSRTEIASVIDAHAESLAEVTDPILLLSRLLGITRLTRDTRHYLADCARWREDNLS